MGGLTYRALEVEAFLHATESEPKVETALRLILPRGSVQRESLGGHFGQPLTRLSLEASDPAEVLPAVDRLRTAVGVEIARTAARRIDRDLVLHLRLDKQAAARGAIRLETAAEHDIVKVEVRLGAPRLNRPGAIALVQREFGGQGTPEEE